ncbi:MAG: zinc ribbon domain-containing protein [Clostridia bacterium]|nr:zinc ribbon domain-containing protein [Clostridia bacterium]
MYCRNCGKEVDDNAIACPHCGCAVTRQRSGYGEPKTGIGALLGLFLGIIGLIIGLCLYPADTVERKTFLKGWGIAFAIEIIVVIILYAVVFSSILGALSSF